MRFTFVLAGWPGSLHDMRVFTDAMTKYNHIFPHPPTGKHLPMLHLQVVVELVQTYQTVVFCRKKLPGRLGLPKSAGLYLASYQGTKYHLLEYRDGPEPQGKKEIFIFAHSSLRNVNEMSFGVLKMKWRILLHMPSYAPDKQSQIIVACMALHNFIRASGIVDRDFDRCDRDKNYVPPEASAYQPRTRQTLARDESAMMNAFHDSIALGLLNRS